jgi:hypothetical protein
MSIVPIRDKPSDKAEMISQLLFGESFKILEIPDNKKWWKIENDFDGYKGWIDRKQGNEITDEYYHQVQALEYKICTDVISSILYKKQLLNIVIGSILPITSSELFEMHEQFAFNGESKNMGKKSDFETLKKIALKFRNAPYLWGGKTPFGIDCSGFTQQVFKICGYSLKRDSHQQYLQGKKIDFENKLPGDIAFFSNDQEKIVHVGILLEGNQIIHASGKVRVDILDEKGIFNEELNDHTHKLAGLRRVLAE